MKTAAEILGIGDIKERLATLAEKQRVALLADENSCELCYPLVCNDRLELFVVPAGEEAKQLEIATFVWQQLLESGLSRGDYFVTLGGGSVSDLGGFVASTYMRGMPLINIPTTLLAMIDASVGGKTAIDFQHIKNLLGTFYEPQEVWITLDFLESLPHEQLMSGLGEMMKYGLLVDEELFQATLRLSDITPEIVGRVVQYKLDVVAADRFDYGYRMRLNLGHTTAHSLEALSLSRGEVLPHGYAVAAGLVVALYISHRFHGLDSTVLTTFARAVKEQFPVARFTCTEYDRLWAFALKDKKNTESDSLRMVLLSAVGKPITVQVTQAEWKEALDFYRDYMY